MKFLSFLTKFIMFIVKCTHQIFGKTLMFYLFWGVNFVITLQVHKGTDGKQVWWEARQMIAVGLSWFLFKGSAACGKGVRPSVNSSYCMFLKKSCKILVNLRRKIGCYLWGEWASSTPPYWILNHVFLSMCRIRHIAHFWRVTSTNLGQKIHPKGGEFRQRSHFFYPIYMI